MKVLLHNSTFSNKIQMSIELLSISLLLCSFLLLCAQTTFAADLLMSPSVGSYAVGQNFTVTVQADPKGDSVNAVEAGL